MIDAHTTVRPGEECDAIALEDLFMAVWKGAYQGIIPGPDIERMVARRTVTYWKKLALTRVGFLVVEVDGTVAGYVTFGPARSAGPWQGEIYELYLDPPYQGMGLGEQLFEAARVASEAAGRKGLIVWALTDNELARNFYLRRGGTASAAAKEKFAAGKILSKIGYAFA